MPVLKLSNLDIINTHKSLLAHRIAGCIFNRTKILQLVGGRDPFRFIPGPPPIQYEFPTPCMYLWFERTDMEINSEGPQEISELVGNIKIVLKNSTNYEPLAIDIDTGAFKDKIIVDTINHTAQQELYALEDQIRLVLLEEGYKQKWYYGFVQHGVLAEINEIRITSQSFGGGDTRLEMTSHLNVIFRPTIWETNAYEYAVGDLVITVEDGVSAPIVGAKVEITDVNGNNVWDPATGQYVWETDGSGQVSLSSMLAQRELTITATSGSSSASETGVEIKNADTENVTVTIP